MTGSETLTITIHHQLQKQKGILSDIYISLDFKLAKASAEANLPSASEKVFWMQTKPL